MASILIRGLDDQVKAKLKIRAATHGRSMEAEAREILKEGLRPRPEIQRPNLAESMRSYVERFGGIDLKLPKRRIVRRPRIFE
jgi:antitoxin FitA